jgi:hypothetical protein
MGRHVENSDSNKKWLKYSDEHSSRRGFVEWSKHRHPTLGDVEIGGFVPTFTHTPPSDEMSEIAAGQIRFLAELSKMLPAPRFAPSKVKDLGGGLWRIEIRIANDSLLPTHLAIARQIRNPSFTVAPDVNAAQIVGGRVTERIANIPGSGDAQVRTWIVRGAAGASITFRAFNREFGEFKTQVVLKETAPGQEGE